MTPKEKAAAVVSILKSRYPAICSLTSEAPWQLLFATRLSAQCTDERVNQVTPVLFSRFPSPRALADADILEIEEIIRPCGLFHTKARELKAAAAILDEVYGGQVPDTLEALTALPGIGRKTANLIMGDVWGQPAIVADTHCIRIAGRLGLSSGKDPYKVELALKKIVDPSEQSDLCHRFVHFGRDVCTARAPKCGACPLSSLCSEYLKK